MGKPDHAELRSALHTVRGALEVARSNGRRFDVTSDLSFAVGVLDALGGGFAPQVYTRATYRTCADAMRHAPELAGVAKLFEQLVPFGSP
jgi:hypothetical protein